MPHSAHSSSSWNWNRLLLAAGVLALTLAPLFITPTTVRADACEDTCDQENSDEKMQCLNNKRSCLETKLQETLSQKNTVSSTISVLNGKIRLQELQINQTLTELEQLEREVEALDERINGLNISLDRLSTMLVERVRSQYKQRKVSPYTFFLDKQESFGKVLAQAKYLSLAGSHTAYAMEKAENQRLQYDEQKLLKEEKQQQVVAKQALLEQQQTELAVAKQEQQNFLEVTKSNERRYQELLEAARKELAQIQSAANIVIREGNGVAVKRGETIGTMGNSGYSTGAHLHFGVYKYTVSEFENTGEWGWYYSNIVDPVSKLKPETVTWGTGCSHDPKGSVTTGNGDWDWPMSDVRITQNYGSNTCYNFMYGGKTHPALDIVGMGSHSVKAVSDGEAYFCRNCLGDGGNGVFVFHDGGYMSLYWHLK